MYISLTFCLSFRNIFTGLILERYGYFILEIFFIICLEIALLAAAILYIYNSLEKGMLNDSPAIRHARQEDLRKTSAVNQEPPPSELVKTIGPIAVALEYL